MAGVMDIRYAGRDFTFRSPKANDWILERMRTSGSFYEWDMLEWLREHAGDAYHKEARSTGDILDIGAYIGTHAAYFSAFFNRVGCVWAFEANLGTIPFLLENVQTNASPVLGEDAEIRVVAQAVGAGTWCSRTHMSSSNSGAARYGSEFEPKMPVQFAVALDTCLFSRPIHLMKIDVEGFELQVLTGAHKLIARDLPVIAIESDKPAVVHEVLNTLPHRTLGSYRYECVKTFARGKATHVYRAEVHT